MTWTKVPHLFVVGICLATITLAQDDSMPSDVMGLNSIPADPPVGFLPGDSDSSNVKDMGIVGIVTLWPNRQGHFLLLFCLGTNF